MERSTIHLLAKRGKSQRAIARELGRGRVTVARALQESVDKAPAQRHRRSIADPFESQIRQWLDERLWIVRMVELARTDPDHPYSGRISVFGDAVRRIRRELAEKQADAPIRLAGRPAEYLQVAWGEIRRFPFSQQPGATRSFLACRLKYSRGSWVRWTTDMRRETLLRGLVACFCALGGVPWVLTFDHMKTVTSGRDPTNQPLWTPALPQLAAAFDFPPEAGAIGAANQKGSVESVVKWVKGNFLAGRLFADDGDLAHQTVDWLAASNARPSSATGEPPLDRLVAEAAKGGRLPRDAHDDALLDSGHVTGESLVPRWGNVYSVPLGHVGAAVTIRLHAERVRIGRDTTCLADHPRAPAGAHRRIIAPAHFADLFGRKGRAPVMLYRAALGELGEAAASYVGEVSRRRREKLREEILALYALREAHGAARLLAAMRRAQQVGAYGAEYIRALVEGGPPTDTIPGRLTLVVPGVPRQEAIDRRLSSYEASVEGSAVAVGGGA